MRSRGPGNEDARRSEAPLAETSHLGPSLVLLYIHVFSRACFRTSGTRLSKIHNWAGGAISVRGGAMDIGGGGYGGQLGGNKNEVEQIPKPKICKKIEQNATRMYTTKTFNHFENSYVYCKYIIIIIKCSLYSVESIELF